MTWSGLFTALITPFDYQGEVDLDGLRLLIQRQKEAGVDGIVVLGTTGENASLTPQEKHAILQVAQQECSPLRLMVGCGCSSSSETLANIHQAAQMGAEGALVIIPYYNKPTQEGLFQHFQFLARHSPLPLMIYNNPKRTGINLASSTLKRLAAFPQIVGLKEATGNFEQMSEIVGEIKTVRPSFVLVAGDDIDTFPLMALGGDGVIAVASNLFPKDMKQLITACLNNQWVEARALHYKLLPAFRAFSLETNPIPLKAAMKLAGLPSGDPRLPLTPLSPHLLSHLNALKGLS